MRRAVRISGSCTRVYGRSLNRILIQNNYKQNGRHLVAPASKSCTVTSKRQFSTSRSLRQEEVDNPTLEPREFDEVDVCIVGAGPAGLAAAIRFKQLEQEHGHEIRVVVIEKASELGAHTLSGAVIEPRALDELLPNWRDDPPPFCTPVSSSSFAYLLPKQSIPMPEPPQMHGKGNYVVSLNEVVKWLGAKAEELGVEIYPGFSVNELLHGPDGSVSGIATKDVGVDKHGRPKANFTRGMEFHAKLTFLAEGCHGSLTKQAIKKFELRKRSDPQTYGIGLKEVWEIKPENFVSGKVTHSLGYPLNMSTYGGGFVYHFGENLVSLGLVVGLDYANPWISPYQEFQRFKHHPSVAKVLDGGKCVSYGARALNEGGLQSIPKLSFPGGVLIGCAAGFLNVPKIKGSHTAMKSGMLAAESAYDVLKEEASPSVDAGAIYLTNYEKALRNSWVYDELYEVRNARPAFHSPLKNIGGMIYSGLTTFVTRGKEPWTFHHKQTDAAATKPASQFKKIEYPKPDGIISFDLMTSVSRTGTYHDEDEPVHLQVKDWEKHTEACYPKYKGVEQRFCPAGVYEYIEDDSKPEKVRFQINSQNCIHCKTCDIKVPTQDINWVCPEGGEGPKYQLT